MNKQYSEKILFILFNTIHKITILHIALLRYMVIIKTYQQ